MRGALLGEEWSNLFCQFCYVLLTAKVQGPRLSLVVIETGIVARLYLMGGNRHETETILPTDFPHQTSRLITTTGVLGLLQTAVMVGVA